MPDTSTDQALFDDVADLDHRVRTRDPETSWLAAQLVAPVDVRLMKSWIVQTLARVPGLTDDALYRAYKAAGGSKTAQRLRTVRQELTAPAEGRPIVVESPEMGVSDAGNPARRWRLRDER